MDQKLNAANYGTGPAISALVGTAGYIRATPVCPSAGAYTVATAIALTPTCSISVGNSDTNYQSGGKFYHGM